MHSSPALEPVIALFNASKLAEAKALGQNLCAHQLSDNKLAWCLLAAIHLKLKELEDAEQCSLKAIGLDSNDTQAQYYLGLSLFQQGRHDAAIQPLLNALDANPSLLDVYIVLNNIYNHKGLTDESVNILRRAHEIFPDNTDISCLLAEALEKANATEAALELAKHALQLTPMHPVANIVTARLDTRMGNFSQALERLQGLLDQVKLGEANFSNTQYLLGKIYDRLGRYPEAFTAYELANSAATGKYGNQHRGGVILDRIYRYQGAINSETIKQWQQVPDSEIDPVFLVGFPRSGTTLTEQILASHPSIVTSDERPFLNDTFEKLVTDTPAGANFPYSLDRLSTSDVIALREHYYQVARAYLGSDLEGNVFIDKLPLNIIEVGLIKRLFNNPRFILVLRDPRDACLSCFMQSFIPNHAMANFLTLENAARFYAATMDLWLHYQKVFDLDVIEIRYEKLVSDPRQEIGRLVEFLGLEWNDSVLNYHERDDLSVSTPSYQDISTPIYTRAISRWHNYQEQFQSLQSRLEPYVNAFGYQNNHSA